MAGEDEAIADDAGAAAPPAVQPAGGKVEPSPAPVADVDEYEDADNDGGDAADEEGDTHGGSLIDSLDDDEDASEGDGQPAQAKPDARLTTVPKTAADYEIPTVKGVEWSDSGKGHWSKLAANLHKAGASQGAMDAIGSAVNEMMADLSKLDATTSSATTTEMTSELGAEEFKSERARIKSALKAMPGRLGNDFLNARFADGRKVINDPNFFRWMVGQNAKARVPTTKDRMKEIERIRNTDIDEYYAQGLSDEYYELLVKKERGE